MESFLPLAGFAAAVFVATDIDDLFLLVAFFSDPRFRTRDVVIGQYLGVGALYAASAVASLASLVVPLEYIGLLGLAPLLIGASQLRRVLGAAPDGDAAEEGHPGASERWAPLAVAAVTIANGADNISVYTPLFATRSGVEVAVFGAVFALLIAAWCLLARWLVDHAVLGAPIRRYSARVVPFVFIALGLLILYEAGTYRLLGL